MQLVRRRHIQRDPWLVCVFVMRHRNVLSHNRKCRMHELRRGELCRDDGKHRMRFVFGWNLVHKRVERLRPLSRRHLRRNDRQR